MLLRRLTPVAWVSVTVIAVDQVSKAAAGMAGPGSVDFNDPVRNNALTLQSANTGRWLEVLAMTLGIIAAALLARRWVPGMQASDWAAALVIGGVTSNLADRAVLGGVRDLLAHGWFMVNLADLALLAGLAIALRPLVRLTGPFVRAAGLMKRNAFLVPARYLPALGAIPILILEIAPRVRF